MNAENFVRICYYVKGIHITFIQETNFYACETFEFNNCFLKSKKQIFESVHGRYTMFWCNNFTVVLINNVHIG